MLYIYFVGMNLLSFLLFGLDKYQAVRHRFRIPERVLLGTSALGGALGSLLGMLLFHHKVKKAKFRIWIPSLLAAYLVSFLIFIGFRYRAQPEAFKSLQSDSDISVSYVTNNLILMTPQQPKAGIIFYPGALVQFEAYGPLMRKCARRGYACAIVRMPLNLAFLNGNAAVKIKNYFTGVPHWFIAGHSLGGVIAASCAGSHPEDFDGVIMLAAYSVWDLRDSGLRVLSIYGSRDGVLNMEKYQKYKKNLPAGMKEYIIEGGNHAFFGDYGDQAGDMEASISRDEQMEQTAGQMDLFIEQTVEQLVQTGE